jgi:hypothetical protein
VRTAYALITAQPRHREISAALGVLEAWKAKGWVRPDAPSGSREMGPGGNLSGPHVIAAQRSGGHMLSPLRRD